METPNKLMLLTGICIAVAAIAVLVVSSWMWRTDTLPSQAVPAVNRLIAYERYQAEVASAKQTMSVDPREAFTLVEKAVTSARAVGILPSNPPIPSEGEVLLFQSYELNPSWVDVHAKDSYYKYLQSNYPNYPFKGLAGQRSTTR